MRILVTGANGFIGSHIVAALKQTGHTVFTGIRESSQSPQTRTFNIDFNKDTEVEIWLERLQEIDVVVNCVGILRENHRTRFERVLRDAPIALFKACSQANVKKVIQISALGGPSTHPFLKYRYEADAYLRQQNIDSVILRPSMVYSPHGSYGGSSLLRALAALPFLIPVPGTGRQEIQPITLEDLGRAVVTAVENPTNGCIEIDAVGPDPMQLITFLLSTRHWLGFRKPMILPVPRVLLRALGHIGEWLGRGPIGTTLTTLMQHPNIGAPGASNHFHETLGFSARSVEQAYQAAPSQVQDRWHARLYFVFPLLTFCLAFLWIVSGISGLVTPLPESLALLEQSGVKPTLGGPLIITASLFDLVIGFAVLIRYRPILVGNLMLLSLLAYTLFLGVFLPSLWLEPFGALIKNIPMIPAILTYMVLQDPR